MRIPYAIKLGTAITALTLASAGSAVLYLYARIHAVTVSLVTARLVDIGHAASFLFNAEDRARIERLTLEVNRLSSARPEAIVRLAAGDSLPSIVPAGLASVHASEDFLSLVDRLGIITYASMDEVAPLRRSYPVNRPLEAMARGLVVAYLYVDAPETDDPSIVKFIASCSPFPTADGWAGNPAGNLYRVVEPFYHEALAGSIGRSSDYTRDSFYTGLTAVVPLLAKDGSTLAVRGLDYFAGNEHDELQSLRVTGAWLVALGTLAALSMAIAAAMHLSSPLLRLERTAALFSAGNREVSFRLRRNDEFGALGESLEAMAESVRRYLAELSSKNRELAEHSERLELRVAERTAELLEANTRLEVMANTDRLTGLANRRSFDDYLEREWRLCARQNLPIALILADVDRFKDYNDRYGHHAGDECLARVAAAVAGAPRRPSDLAARYGGEEFAIVMPGCARDGAIVVAERLLESVRALGLRREGGAALGIVTVSCGLAAVVPSETEGGPEGLLKAADQALYQAKREGRDRLA